MSKLVFMLGSGLLWLLTACGIVWWSLTAIRVYEAEWAVLACVVVPGPLVLSAYIAQRVWKWAWVISNSRKASAKRLSSHDPAGTDPLGDRAPGGRPPPGPQLDVDMSPRDASSADPGDAARFEATRPEAGDGRSGGNSTGPARAAVFGVILGALLWAAIIILWLLF